MRNFFLLVLVIVFLVKANAISRIGNSMIGDFKQGFQTQIPNDFQNIRDFSDGSIKLRSSKSEYGRTQSGIVELTSIEARDYAQVYKDLTWNDRSQAKLWFTEKGNLWEEITGENPCALMMIASTNQGVTGVATWGQQRGIVLYGPYRKSVYDALIQMMKDIELTEEACQWNY